MKLLPLLATLALLPQALPTQQTQPPTLDQILLTLQSSIADYVHALPNLYCDEHVLSTLTPHSSNFLPSHTTVESIFRVRRPPTAKSLADLQESRDPRLVDGQPLTDEFGFPNAVQLPTLILGVFATAPALFATTFAQCLNFRLAPSDTPTHLTLDFSTNPATALTPACAEDQSTSGRAILDAQTLRLLRIEKRTSNYPIYPKLRGTWTWAVDYAPTELAGRTFWLPTHIASNAIADRTHANWTFDATYTNYHRLTVTSRILPAPPPPKP